MEAPSPAPILIAEKVEKKEELVNKVKNLLKENEELKQKVNLDNFNRNILYLVCTFIIFILVIITIYLHGEFNNINNELKNTITFLSDCKSELIEIESTHYICKDNLSDCLDHLNEKEDISIKNCISDNNQLELYDKKKKGYSFTLFSINIGI